MDKPRRRPPRRLKPGSVARSMKSEIASQEFIRQRFLEKRILERAAKGELAVKILHTGTPAPSSGQDEGTRSEYIAYLGPDGRTIAEAHRFVRLDGSIGASGMPDPKMILYMGTIYSVAEPGCS